MIEVFDLTALETRRPIVVKRPAPSERLASCVDRSKALDHAVYAVPVRSCERGWLPTKRADEVVVPCNVLPSRYVPPNGIQDFEERGSGPGVSLLNPASLNGSSNPEKLRIAQAIRDAGDFLGIN